MIIDAHQHVWDLTRAPYPWLGPHVPQWNRTFTFEELAPALARHGVGATVMVQSDDSDADTDLMLEVADRHPEVVGIVAYVPLERPAEAEARLASLRRDRRVVGVRNLIHDQPDPDWLLRPDVDEGLGVLAAAGVPFDLVAVLPQHLEHVAGVLERHPDLRIVVDHLAKPPIGQGEVEPWWSLIGEVASHPTVHAKVSGLYPGADMASWTPDSVLPFVERAVEVFGPTRLMYGGDWPISVAAGGYDRVVEGLVEVLGRLLDPAEVTRVLAGTAADFYRLDADLLAARGADDHLTV
ncbi:amidohydrolase family protein [Nocardioides bruguierae]|uniref:amidohydrolase family protein n=1 Tax=Nocardioides bruguierae TaxID=2945102 RepID=UPI0020221BF4|nr:amidohydrolase family protein [Nocardioides bruguierae]MCL8025497.1 amidohydrolase family protein [Nocardioides bruguierae]